MVCPATSDMLVLRNLGIPAFGFTTKAKTISRIHGKDEYHNVETFMKGIDIYTEVIKNLGNLHSVSSQISEEGYDNNKLATPTSMSTFLLSSLHNIQIYNF